MSTPRRPPRALVTTGAVYVLTVTALAAFGFATGSTAAILLAGLLALPTSIPAVVGYYVLYGVLAQVPGANPDTSTGSASCSPSGACASSTSGEAAPWFVLTTDVAGVLALTAAALLNAAVLYRLTAGRRALAADPGPPGPGATGPRRASSG